MSLARRLLRLLAPGHASKLEKAEAEAVEAHAVTMFAAAVTASSLPPEYKSALLDRGRRGDEPSEAIAYAQDIRDRCFAASNASGRRSLALGPGAIRSNVSPQELASSLMEQIAEEDEAVQLVNTVPPTVTKRDRNGNPYEAAPSPQADALAKRLDPREIYDGLNGRNNRPDKPKRNR